jgi:hypothetical protein
MKISSFRAACKKCGQNFITSQLPEMSYGTFLYYATNGKTVKYYEAIDDPIWQQAESVVQETKPEMNEDGQGDLIRCVIGFLADSSDEETHFTTDTICPNCQAVVHTVHTLKKMDQRNWTL